MQNRRTLCAPACVEQRSITHSWEVASVKPAPHGRSAGVACITAALSFTFVPMMEGFGYTCTAVSLLQKLVDRRGECQVLKDRQCHHMQSAFVADHLWNMLTIPCIIIIPDACCRPCSLTCEGQCWKRCTSTMWRAPACTQSWSSWMLLWATCVQLPMTPCMLTWPAHCCKPPLWQCSAYCWMEDHTGMGCFSCCSA